MNPFLQLLLFARENSILNEFEGAVIVDRSALESRAMTIGEKTITELLAAARGGSLRAVGKLLSMVESDRRAAVLAELPAGRVRTIGITGPPGAGKSTTVAV